MKTLLKVTALITLCSLLGSTALAGDDQSDKQLERKARTFLKFDTDGDQQLDQAEYTEMIKSWFENKGKSGYEKAAERRFNRKDANGDGFVSFEEQHGQKLPG